MEVQIEYLDDLGEIIKVWVDLVRQDTDGNNFFRSDIPLLFRRMSEDLYCASNLEIKIIWSET